MTKLTLALWFCGVAFAQFNPSGWGRVAVLTVNHLKAPASGTYPIILAYNVTSDNATNLPQEMLVAGGSNAAKSDGSDIRITDNAGNGLHFKVRRWTQHATTDSSRKAQIIVLATVSSTVDTALKVYYNNPSASAPAATDSTFGSNGIWDSNYKGVYHLGDGSTLTLTDDTANANNLSLSATPPTAVNGVVGGGMSTNGSSSYATTANGPALTANFTVEFWLKRNSAQSGFPRIIGKEATSNTNWGFTLGAGSTNQIYVTRGNGGGSESATINGVGTGTWYYIVGTYDGSTITGFICSAGSCTATTAASARFFTDNAFPLTIGKLAYSTGGYSDISLDELRLSDTNRGSNYVTLQYNNQSSPSTFWKSVGAPSNVVSTNTTVMQPIQGE